MPGPDHKASLESAELKAMVKAIRNIEAALGSPDKHVTASEAANIAVARKSIVAARHIRKGEVLSPDNCAQNDPARASPPCAGTKYAVAKRSATSKKTKL